MASKAQQAQKYIKIINQQLEILNGEKQSVIETLDHSINQVLSEVNAWVNGGHVNHTTYAEMNNIIQKLINLFMAKSAEISDLETEENKSDSDLLQTTTEASNIMTIPKTSYTRDQVQDKVMLCRVETVHSSGDPFCVDSSYVTTMRFAILEEAVFSLKKTTEQIQEQQGNVNKKLEILKNANLKSKKNIQERLTVLEKNCKEFSSNVDALFEHMTHVDVKLNRLEDENKSVNVSMNELNKQISSVRTCSNDALMSIQDLSKSVESTNQHYNEMSNKMNQLEISINLMSSQYTEQFENMSCTNKEHVENLVDSLGNELAEISGKVTQIENKFNPTPIGFYAIKRGQIRPECFEIDNFDEVSANYGSCFNQTSGEFTAPQNGLYLISINIVLISKVRSFNITCFQVVNGSMKLSEHYNVLCDLSGNECVTRLVELKKGDILLLAPHTKEKEPIDCVRIEFLCCVIK